MNKIMSIKKNYEFRKVYNHGKSLANRYLVLYIYSNGLDNKRLGISVSKKVGNSVVRHRITRLIREAYRLNQSIFNNSYDYVFIARNASSNAQYHDIERSMIHLLKRHKGWIEQ